MIFKNLLFKFIVIVLILSLFGCKAVVKKGYSGPDLPSTKIAKIFIPATVYLQKLDGKPYLRPELNPKTFYYIDVLPGLHSITFLPIYSSGPRVYISGIGTKIDFLTREKNIYEPKFLFYNIRSEYNKTSYQSRVWVQNKTKYKEALRLFKKGKYEEAILSCNEAIEDSYCPDTYALRGNNYFQLGNYEKAISDYNEGISFNPNPSPIYFNRGLANFKLNKITNAIDDYNMAMKVRPLTKKSHFEILMNRSEAYLKVEVYDKARNDLRQACEIPDIDHKPILYALHNGHTLNAKLLIDENVDIDVKDDVGWTPLMYSIRYNHPDIAKKLINKDFEINNKDLNGWTPLMLALRYNQTELAKILLKKGCAIEAKTNDGWTALMFAARYNQPENLKRLIEMGGRVNLKNSFGWTPLLVAIKSGNIKTVKILLDANANIHVRTNDGRGAKEIAEEYGNKEIIQILEKAETL